MCKIYMYIIFKNGLEGFKLYLWYGFFVKREGDRFRVVIKGDFRYIYNYIFILKD